jgi:hypothetical protein
VLSFVRVGKNPNFLVTSKIFLQPVHFLNNEKLINPPCDYPDVCLFGKNNPVGKVALIPYHPTALFTKVAASNYSA